MKTSEILQTIELQLSVRLSFNAGNTIESLAYLDDDVMKQVAASAKEVAILKALHTSYAIALVGYAKSGKDHRLEDWKLSASLLFGPPGAASIAPHLCHTGGECPNTFVHELFHARIHGIDIDVAPGEQLFQGRAIGRRFWMQGKEHPFDVDVVVLL